MGVTAKAFGKFGGTMRKIKNQVEAEAYSAKHASDKKKSKKEKEKEN